MTWCNHLPHYNYNVRLGLETISAVLIGMISHIPLTNETRRGRETGRNYLLHRKADLQRPPVRLYSVDPIRLTSGGS